MNGTTYGYILTFLIGLIFAIRFMLQIKQQDKEEYERKKAKDELDYDDIPDTLSQLIRTAFIARDEHKFIVSDFSAIEARVLAFLVGETWRSKVFAEGKDMFVGELTGTAAWHNLLCKSEYLKERL